jgi:hypothetical protein
MSAPALELASRSGKDDRCGCVTSLRPQHVSLPVIEQGTWHLEDSGRDVAVRALMTDIDLGLTHIDASATMTLISNSTMRRRADRGSIPPRATFRTGSRASGGARV